MYMVLVRAILNSTRKFTFFCKYSDINECASNPCAYGDCEDRVDGYICYCFGGWEGTNCDQGICVFIKNTSSKGIL